MTSKHLVRTTNRIPIYRYEVWVEFMEGDGDAYKIERQGFADSKSCVENYLLWTGIKNSQRGYDLTSVAEWLKETDKYKLLFDTQSDFTIKEVYELLKMDWWMNEYTDDPADISSIKIYEYTDTERIQLEFNQS